MNEKGRACLSDFGLAQIKTHTTTIIRQSDDLLSQRVGTAKYMAPEQLVRGTTNTATDIYSFGMTIYEVSTCYHFLPLWIWQIIESDLHR